MTKRLTSLLIIWLTLFSVAVPAIACAGAMHHGDCCPDKGKPPCGECPDKAPAPGTSQDHCLAAPSSATISSAAPEQARKLLPLDLEPVAIAPASLETPPRNDSTAPGRRWRTPPDNSESPTYLITGRLRL